jgi:hypothetical protein
VRSLLDRSEFRRLLAARLSAQFGDGVLQAALAGTVLFNPQRAADPVAVAAGFAVLLLPYSLVGRSPESGWTAGAGGRCSCTPTWCAPGWSASWRCSWRRSAGSAVPGRRLVLFSVARFVLSALSASLPHTTARPGAGQRAGDDGGRGGTVVGGGGRGRGAAGRRHRRRGYAL